VSLGAPEWSQCPRMSLPLLLLVVSSGHALVPVLDLRSPVPQSLVSELRTHGALVVSGLGPAYLHALEALREEAPNCLEKATLSVTMDDGSERVTTARDTETRAQPFPGCVNEEVVVITNHFDLVDKLLAGVLREEFGDRLDVMDQGGNTSLSRSWEEMGSKTHLHVYRQTDEPTASSLSLPFHTDNGFYVVLTPSSSLPLRYLSKDGEQHVLDTPDDSIIVLLGTGLTSWLLGPDSDLHSPPHALPALSSSLSSKPRTVMARMRVAPAQSVPISSPSSPTFWEHFSSPLDTETGPTLARLRKQRSLGNDCSPDWPHACTHDSRRVTILGEP